MQQSMESLMKAYFSSIFSKQTLRYLLKNIKFLIIRFIALCSFDLELPLYPDIASMSSEMSTVIMLINFTSTLNLHLLIQSPAKEFMIFPTVSLDYQINTFFQQELCLLLFLAL